MKLESLESNRCRVKLLVQLQLVEESTGEKNSASIFVLFLRREIRIWNQKFFLGSMTVSLHPEEMNLLGQRVDQFVVEDAFLSRIVQHLSTGQSSRGAVLFAPIQRQFVVVEIENVDEDQRSIRSETSHFQIAMNQRRTNGQNHRIDEVRRRVIRRSLG